jgi:hypothetical protein
VLITVTTGVHNAVVSGEPQQIRAEDEVGFGVHHDDMLAVRERRSREPPAGRDGTGRFHEHIDRLAPGGQVAVLTHSHLGLTNCVVHLIKRTHDTIVAV